MSNTKKEEKVYDVLTQYGITDRLVAITTRGIIVYVPASYLGNAIQACSMI